MAPSTLAFLAGICSLFFLAAAPAPGLCALLAVAAVACLLRPGLRWVGALALGFAWAGIHAGRVAADGVPPDRVLKDILVQGEVLGLPERRADGSLQFRFRIARWQAAAEPAWQEEARTVLLTWYRDAPRIGTAQRWQLRVKLKPRRGLANPGGFDYARWLFAQRLAGTGYVRSGTLLRLPGAAACLRPDRWRQGIARWIDGRLSEADRGLVKALAIGDRSGIADRDWNLLRATGTSHLVAISGLHIGFVAGMVYLAVRRIRALIHWPAAVPATVAAAWAGLIAAGLYALLAGMTLPTQRALIMVGTFMSARIVARRGEPLRTFQIALWLVLMHDPLAVLSDGFWLSFGAVGCILFVSGARFGAQGRLRRALTVQLGLAVGLLPVMISSFQQVPLLGPLANALAVPLVGVVAVPLVLASLVIAPVAPTLSGYGLQVAAILLKALMTALGMLAALPQSQWSQAVGVTWQLLPLGAGALLVLAPRGVPVRALGVVLLLAAVLHQPPVPDAGDAWATLLDVGQGLAAVVRTRSHTLVYDAGPRFPSGLDTGAAVVVPYLLHAGVRRVAKLVVSHDDMDHIGGARAVYRALDVQRILSGTPEAIDWARSTRCRAGQHWRWDGVAFEVLAPYDDASGNNASCVLKVMTDQGRTLLLTGDIEAPLERRLIAGAEGRLRADTLVVPHHGSRTSSTPAFIDHVMPRLALFPAGYANRFGFPKAEILERYRSRGVQVLITGDAGAITLRMNTGHVESFRVRQPRIWRPAAPG